EGDRVNFGTSRGEGLERTFPAARREDEVTGVHETRHGRPSYPASGSCDHDEQALPGFGNVDLAHRTPLRSVAGAGSVGVSAVANIDWGAAGFEGRAGRRNHATSASGKPCSSRSWGPSPGWSVRGTRPLGPGAVRIVTAGGSAMVCVMTTSFSCPLVESSREAAERRAHHCWAG